jgi:hypothetical protein
MTQQKVIMMVCDNPTCRSRYEHSKEEPALGYHLGKGLWADDGGGGPIPATYACSLECIGPAVEHTIRESRQ